MTRAYILHYLKEHKEEIFRRFSLKKMGLFGSFATDSADEKSDIDILIESEKKDFFVRDALREHLQEVFQRPVDIGYSDSIRRFYKSKIDQEIIYV